MSSMIKNISLSTLAFSAVFMCACSDGSAGAAGDYVKASAGAEKAAAAFEKADYSGALALAGEAEKLVKGITEKYPDSDIAFKIVSDGALRLGPMRYGDFRGKFLPVAGIVADPAFKPFDLSWAACFGVGSASDESLLAFGSYLLFYNAQINALKYEGVPFAGEAIPQEECEKLVGRVAERMKNAAAQSALKGRIASGALAAAEARAKPTPLVPMNPAQSKLNVPVATPDKFLADATREAGRTVYNLEAARKLSFMANEALADGKVCGQFGEILASALENAQKISSRKMRNSALGYLVEALSKIALNDEALAGSMNIENDAALKSASLEKIAYSYAAHGNYDAAFGVALGFAESLKKTEMLLRLCSDMARAGMGEKALEMLPRISDLSARSAALTMIAGSIWVKDPKKAIEILKQANPAFLSDRVLVDFCLMAGLEFQNPAGRDARKLSAQCAIASALLPLDADLSARWEASAMRSFGAVTDPAELAFAVKTLGKLKFKACRNADVLEAAITSISKAEPQAMFIAMSELGLEAGLRGDAVLAENLFANALSLAKSPALKANLASNGVYAAWQMQLSGMPRDKAVALLGDFLPRASE